MTSSYPVSLFTLLTLLRVDFWRFLFCASADSNQYVAFWTFLHLQLGFHFSRTQSFSFGSNWTLCYCTLINFSFWQFYIPAFDHSNEQIYSIYAATEFTSPFKGASIKTTLLMLPFNWSALRLVGLIISLSLVTLCLHWLHFSRLRTKDRVGLNLSIDLSIWLSTLLNVTLINYVLVYEFTSSKDYYLKGWNMIFLCTTSNFW